MKNFKAPGSDPDTIPTEFFKELFNSENSTSFFFFSE